jgi:hypothetical protein
MSALSASSHFGRNAAIAAVLRACGRARAREREREDELREGEVDSIE